MLRQADAVTVVTEGVRDAVVAKGVEPLPDLLAAQRRRHRTSSPLGADGTRGPGEAATVLYAGTHGYVHGLEVVLDAAEHLAERDGAVPARRRRLGEGLPRGPGRTPVGSTTSSSVTLWHLGRWRTSCGSATSPSLPCAASRSSGRCGRRRCSLRWRAGSRSSTAASDEGAALVAEVGAGVAPPAGDGGRWPTPSPTCSTIPAEPRRWARRAVGGRSRTPGWSTLVERLARPARRARGQATPRRVGATAAGDRLPGHPRRAAARTRP